MVRKKPLHPDQLHMSLGEHLDELRRRVIYSLLGTGVALAVTLFYGRDIVAFLAVPLNRAQRAAGLVPQAIVHGVTAGFSIYLKAAIVAALVLASPWVIYQMWKFIAAGLYEHERRVVYVLTPLSTLMTGLGLLFAYHVLLPVCLAFLILFSIGYGPPGGEKPGLFDFLGTVTAWFAAPDAPVPQIDVPPAPGDAPDQAILTVPRLAQDPAVPREGQIWIKTPENVLKIRTGGRTLIAYLAVSSLVNPWLELGSYVNFVLFMTLGVVVAFQLPVIMLVVGMSRLMDPAWLARYRRHCLFGCAALGAILTPADPVSMIVLAAPLYGLFELGLLLMKAAYRPPVPEVEEAE